MIRVTCLALAFVLTGSGILSGNEEADEATDFDMKTLVELDKQVRALGEYSDNQFILDEKTVELDKSLQRFQRVRIAWELTVQQVRREAVHLQPALKPPAQIYFVKEMPEATNGRKLSELAAALGQQQTERAFFQVYTVLKIGSTVDADLARRLRRGDKVAVTGEIARIGIHAGRLLVIVSKTKVTGTTKSMLAPATAGQPNQERDVEPKIKSPALNWLALHQSADGSWSFDHRAGQCAGRCRNPGSLTTASNAATAMALLPFLAAGQTHKEGTHKEVIRRGLSFLMENAKKEGTTASFLESGGTMYSQGLCTIVLCEAYGSSADKDLREISQMALNFIVDAQDPVGGGWRYLPRQPGDTSVSGWQLSAIQSGRVASLEVPEKTVIGATRFLDSVQSDEGAKYGYTAPGAGAATTSVGLLARLRLGWQRDNEAMRRGIQFLQERGPSQHDMYYNYHASQLMFQYGGEPWETWNDKMRRFLVDRQDREGHQAGSWYIAGNHGAGRGGRLYCTSLAALTLQIYYRHLAIFRPSNEHEGKP